MKHSFFSYGKSAFTLLEMTIVLTVIALLVGGVLAGQGVIQAAENGRLAKNIEILRSGISSFQAKYNALPGDFADAYTIWGASCASTSANCNGDGNGLVGVYQQWSHKESLNLYLHLKLSGLMDITTTGRDGATGYPNYTVGIDIPQYIGVNSSRFGLFPSTRNDGSLASIPAEAPRRSLEAFTTQGSIAGTYYSRLFPGYESYQFDKKFDDGKANIGSIRAWEYDGNCFVPASADYNTYDVSNKTTCDNLASCAVGTRLGCYLIFSLN